VDLPTPEPAENMVAFKHRVTFDPRALATLNQTQKISTVRNGKDIGRGLFVLSPSQVVLGLLVEDKVRHGTVALMISLDVWILSKMTC
jgi:hypothetical protein